jgi:hypothetical protein
MAFQSGKSAPAGAGKLSTAQPIGSPIAYKSKGTFGRDNEVDRKDLLADTGYGRNQYEGPASVTSVPASKSLSDFDTRPPDGDAVLDRLAGPGEKSALADNAGTGSPVDDLRRKISTEGYPAAYGMKGAAPGAKVPGSVEAAAESAPVRQPGK